jgi:NAD(P)H-dependent flavin oxidoreductase YrpB (nitropropane dioxygenase family)
MIKQIGFVVLLALGLVACNNNAPPPAKKEAATADAPAAKQDAKKPTEAPAPAATPAPPSNIVQDVGKKVEHSVTTGDAAIKKEADK